MTALLAPMVLAACAQTHSAPVSPPPPPVIAAQPAAPSGSVLFSYPVVDGVVSSAFGAVRRSGGGRTRYHSGVDIAAPTGTPVRAAGAGRVAHAGYGYQGSADWGQAVVLDHGDGWITLYAHLSAVNVVAGQALYGGEHIGDVGRTGNATGPHLHIELRHDGVSRDPTNHIPGLGSRR